ncbi:MAG: DUF378 domain-containing protein [Candidatus Uhrbacteria bacterium]|nr:DUF378 domain-containing protein [Candidatus Uhrbacteria bacterium]
MKLHNVAFILLVVGGLNWLAVGLFNWDISAVLGGSASLASKAVYVLVGLSAVYEVATHKVNCRACAGTPSV